MLSKLFITDRVYKVSPFTFPDVPEISFLQGKVRFAKVAKSHQGIVKTLMVSDGFFGTLPETAPKIFINDNVYKVWTTAFSHCCRMLFSKGK